MLYLASASPRRRQLLRQLGIRFRTVTQSVDEESLRRRWPGRFSARRFAVACALAKAASVSTRARSGFVITADTVVALRGHVLGKPASRGEATRMLRLLSGQTHSVITGLVVVRTADNRAFAAAETTRVAFRRLSDAEIRRYVATLEPLDKAGAYGIQERAGIFVSRICGCYLNVVGLPVPRLLALLNRAGYRR